ncbi:hypothetical protein [Roseateles chitinivorans]|uniref:hypothetical protein n=1 Tax=Roseateles chitinivorans TaxID=2917965 RepID=UPI00130447EA|nr:hypothetical protein [Roseateles chitinivorans]
MLPFSEDEAEHYGYDAQLFSMDLTNAIHADAAIEKWLMRRATGDVKEHARSLQIFQMRVWERLFRESYRPLPLEL